MLLQFIIVNRNKRRKTAEFWNGLRKNTRNEKQENINISLYKVCKSTFPTLIVPGVRKCENIFIKLFELQKQHVN